ncbi:hypothetical protein [Sphingomonas sp. RIT328]|uniref:hypothetical protein n=1 Tax=Sphingomonas sp. RIT328 TaxID=1470591 RepID=UPI00044EFCD6|nr:hypothetical protein [Sphingomonas sp. RIT328]EZP49968.1 hypothetical protein BW41_03293 [Sphingomonas sp. RIT328]
MVPIEDELPRTTLDRALPVPTAISREGRSLTREEVAISLGVKAGTGSVNAKTIAAKRFGLIELDPKGGYRVTDLGRRLVAAPSDADLRRTAILRVKPFEQLKRYFASDFDAIHRDDLARALIGFGVGPDRAAEAAGVLERSWSGKPARGETVPFGARGRAPFVQDAGVADRDGASPSPSIGPRDTRPSAALLRHPLVAAVLAQAPEDLAGWEADRRDAWLDLFASTVRYLRYA